MSIAEADVRNYIGKCCAIVDGATLDYISVAIPSNRAARSFSEHAKVVCGEKSTTEIATEVWHHIDDIVSSASGEGRSEAIIKILLYRNKAPAGSRVFRTEVAPIHSGDDDYDGAASINDAMVKVVHELRMTVKDLLNTVQANAAEGWKLAGESLKAERALSKENMELHIALVASDDKGDDVMKQVGAKAANELIDFMKIKAITQLQADAEAKAKE